MIEVASVLAVRCHEESVVAAAEDADAASLEFFESFRGTSVRAMITTVKTFVPPRSPDNSPRFQRWESSHLRNTKP